MKDKNNIKKIDKIQFGIITIFVLLALSFIFLKWGGTKKIRQNPLVDPKFVSNNTLLDPLNAPILKRSGFEYNCNNCHQHINPSDTPKKLIAGHPDIKMDHGVNKRCYNCHQKNNRELLNDINGNEVLFSESARVCQHCHGPKYRDWLIGVHGRPNGYWDKSMGKETIIVTCIACHDPHSPRFVPIEPAPAPVAENYYWEKNDKTLKGQRLENNNAKKH